MKMYIDFIKKFTSKAGMVYHNKFWLIVDGEYIHCESTLSELSHFIHRMLNDKDIELSLPVIENARGE